MDQDSLYLSAEPSVILQKSIILFIKCLVSSLPSLDPSEFLNSFILAGQMDKS